MASSCSRTDPSRTNISEDYNVLLQPTISRRIPLKTEIIRHFPFTIPARLPHDFVGGGGLRRMDKEDRRDGWGGKRTETDNSGRTRACLGTFLLIPNSNLAGGG